MHMAETMQKCRLSVSQQAKMLGDNACRRSCTALPGPCFRSAFIRPLGAEERSLTHPYYELLWAELSTLGLTAAVHAMPGVYNPEWETLERA